MPHLSVFLVRASLVLLCIGAALGSWLLAGAPARAGTHPALRDTHVALMLFGWLVPFVVGTGYWMLPKHPGSSPRGSPGLGWGAVLTYAAGLGSRVTGSLLGLADVRAAGTLGLVVGLAGLVLLLWGRVRPFGAGRPAG